MGNGTGGVNRWPFDEKKKKNLADFGDVVDVDVVDEGATTWGAILFLPGRITAVVRKNMNWNRNQRHSNPKRI